jgi:hypothetical protein
MKHSLIRVLYLVAGLGAALLPLGAQEPAERDPLTPGPRIGPLEIRVYVMDKEKKPVDFKDWTASLTVEPKGPGGASKTYVMQYTTPRADDPGAMRHEWEVRDIEGGQHVAEMVVVRREHAEPLPKEPAPKPGDPGYRPEPRPGEPGAAPEPGDKPRLEQSPDQPRPQEPAPVPPSTEPGGTTDRSQEHAHTGPYFKAELPREDLAKAEFTASVTFTVKGERKTAKNFQYPFVGTTGNGDGAAAAVSACLRDLETHLNGGDLTKAGASADQCLEAMRQGGVESRCPTCMMHAQDIKSAISADNKAQALDHVQQLRAHCEGAHPELKGEKPSDPSPKDDPRKDEPGKPPPYRP